MDNNKPDPYFKKTIPLKYEGQELVFRVSQELFSSQVIDYGTQRLLRILSTEKLDKFGKALDLGCGYGPIGIVLKKVNPASTVHMVDRDALALDYSRQNAELNHITGIQIYGSLGYDNVKDDDFDFIVSNIPAKAGEQALLHLLLDARFYLESNGHVAIVVIDAIVNYVSNVLKTSEDIVILFQKSWPGHTVFHYKFSTRGNTVKPKESSLSRGVYDRTINKFLFNKGVLSVNTTYNLPEFDTLSFETKLLLDNLQDVIKQNIKNVVVCNPGQGYIPVALSRLAQINEIILVDRNLQSLEVSKRNLILNKYPEDKISLFHQVEIIPGNKEKVDYIIGTIPEKQNNEVYEMIIKQSTQLLETDGIVLVSSSSNVINKLEKIIRSEKSLVIFQNKRSRGKRAIAARLKETHNGN